MKTNLALFIALGTAFFAANVNAGEDSCCKTAAALSPRAQANQTMIAGKGDADLARADLGTGARAKASGGHSYATGRSGKDINLTSDRALGVAARAKATGNTGSATIELAPLK